MARKHRYRPPYAPLRPAPYEDEVARWILRTLLRAGAVRAYVAADGELGSEAGKLLQGLSVRLPKQKAKPSAALVLGALHARLCELERRVPAPSFAVENARMIGKLLELNRIETALLAFVVALEAEPTLRECFAELRGRTHASLCRHLALVLRLRRRDVERALAPQGKLRSVPVLDHVRVDSGYEAPLGLSTALEPLLMRPLASEDDLLRQILTRAPGAGLTLRDYPHLSADLDLLTRYLRSALARRRRGVNVLLHGPPGTGKTQLARAVADALHAQLYEVNLEDSDQDAHEGAARLSAYALGQRFLRRRRRTLLLLDEVEDVFPRHRELSFSYRAGSVLTKAWTNQLLEGNPIPTFWISNAIDQLDRAYVRRFDLVIEVGQPPRRVRRAVLDRHLAGFQLQPSYLEQLADIEELSPAHVQRAAGVVSLLGAGRAKHAEADLERVLQSNLRAFSGRTPRRARPASEVAYDPVLLNVDVDVAALLAGLRRNRRATLCFHGPPGTGKTELARHLAREADLPIREYRASDLLDKYVGGTEQRIAQMFECAERDGALLLLDEADGFLAERRGARNAWEVTQVNEMLVQMEHFAGVFICATNLFDHVDGAAMRRFSVKVTFGYLTREQARALFLAALAAFGATAPAHGALVQLDALRVLTPGDFSAVLGRFRLLGQRPDARELLHALAQACADKRVRGGRALGFGR